MAVFIEFEQLNESTRLAINPDNVASVETEPHYEDQSTTLVLTNGNSYRVKGSFQDAVTRLGLKSSVLL